MSPYRSEKQRRYLHAKHPKIAARWDAEERKTMPKKKMPKKPAKKRTPKRPKRKGY